MTNCFIENDVLAWEDIDEGVSRKIMAYDRDLMVLKVKFEKGGVGKIHNHPHTQITYIESGTFEVEIDSEKKIMKGGDAFFIHPDIWHGVVCLEPGILIDTFSPMREDFL